jgi:hypothetical protein
MQGRLQSFGLQIYLPREERMLSKNEIRFALLAVLFVCGLNFGLNSIQVVRPTVLQADGPQLPPPPPPKGGSSSLFAV